MNQIVTILLHLFKTIVIAHLIDLEPPLSARLIIFQVLTGLCFDFSVQFLQFIIVGTLGTGYILKGATGLWDCCFNAGVGHEGHYFVCVGLGDFVGEDDDHQVRVDG